MDYRLRVTDEEEAVFGTEPLLLGGWIRSDGSPEDGREAYYWTHASLELAARLLRRFADLSRRRRAGG